MRITRRNALKAMAATAVAPMLKSPVLKSPVPPPASGSLSAYGATINPRALWVPAKQPVLTGLRTETAVKVLLVHHSDSPNTYAQSAVPGLMRGFLGYHTGPEKKWPDVAYNFFVDRFGGIWEGRTGSIRGPVVGSATGGNQGHSQLICLVGNHATEVPSDAAILSLSRLLAGLSDRYELDADPDATTTFVSQGSNRWPAGTTVTTRSIEGHRAMSQTTCPGDAAFALLPRVRLRVRDLRS